VEEMRVAFCLTLNKSCLNRKDLRDHSSQKLFTMVVAAAAAKSLQSCPTLCNPIDGSPPGSSVPGILQARVLEWGAIAFSGLMFKTLYFFKFELACNTWNEQMNFSIYKKTNVFLKTWIY